MKSRIFVGMFCAFLAGCGSSAPTVDLDDSPGKSFAGPDEISLKALLEKPRSELAAQAVELEQQIQRQEKLRREGQLKLTLMPDARPPHMPAVFREAKFSAAHGFSVPPYLKEGAKDTPLALHLARHGDAEAALKLAEAADAGRLDEHALDRNYPLEWTRLVSLQLQHAQLILAADNVDGGKQLVSLHRQLRELFSEKARSSALGQALLPRGLPALQHASQAWKKEKRERLSRDAETWFNRFKTPAWTWSLPTQRDELSAALHAPRTKNRGVLAPDILRTLDLAALPVPHDAADACWLFFDDAGKLSEFLVAYRPQMNDVEQAAQWAPEAARLDKNQPPVQVTLSALNPTVGALVQVQLAAATPARLPRDLGPLSLDRSFEQNRRLFAWKQRGATVTVSDAKALAALPLPLGERRVTQAELEADGDILKEMSFELAVEGPTTLATIAQPLWEKLGPATVEQNAGIDLVWSDGRTRYRLRAPNARTQPIALGISDSSGVDAAKRGADAQARDRADRQARLANNKPLARLPRALENIVLGTKKADVDRMIPASAVRREFPGGLMAVFPGQVQGPGEAVARDVFTRYDDAGQLVELRVRYFDLPNNKPGTFMKKLESLKASHGPGTTLAAADTSPFADLPPRKSTQIHLGWRDDLTTMTAHTDGNGLELTLRDCPLAHPDGAPLGPFAFLTRGPDGFTLGMPRGDVLKLGGSPAGDALLVNNKGGAHDAILVWFEDERATRIAARLRIPPAVAAQPAKALPEAWVREVRAIGWPWRQDLVGKTPRSWTTLDAQTRYRIFVQEDSQGTHILAEWKDLSR